MTDRSTSSGTPAAALSDVPDGGVIAVEVDGVDIALVRNGDEVYAIYDECSHQSIPLSEGDVEGCEIECWLHGSMFDLRTGKPTNLPATQPVPVYPCTVVGDTVHVDVHHPVNSTSSDTES